MQSPRNDFPQLVEQIIHAHQKEGIAFAQLQSTTAMWPDELARQLHELRQARLIETRPDGRLYPAQRRRKPKVAPGSWQRLRAVFAP